MLPSFRIVADGPFTEDVNIISSAPIQAFQLAATDMPISVPSWGLQETSVLGQEIMPAVNAEDDRNATNPINEF
jgi:hypothetical protein